MLGSRSSQLLRSGRHWIRPLILDGCSPWRCVHVTPVAEKTVAGRYKATLLKTKPLTYEQALNPDQIAEEKGFNSMNTAQLEDTFLQKEEMGQDLPHKMLVEDLFVRKFMEGTFPEAILSIVIIKRQHNLIRIAAVLQRNIRPQQIYFLIGYAEELLSYWLKCPVRLELQTVASKEDLVYKYI